ncbi:MAG: hypothetical protein RSE94_06880 [Pseudomonas sp.]
MTDWPVRLSPLCLASWGQRLNGYRSTAEIGEFALRTVVFSLDRLKHMKILKKTFAISSSFDYISAPRQAEQLEEKR